ncbi:hypothetical protein QBC45DRAFT_325972 [Copromyces sp. CBS 386.78]|nr:hypothetical protein QBC45DRAFT_325972 [Copromyces sp. CBS 386.78]
MPEEIIISSGNYTFAGSGSSGSSYTGSSSSASSGSSSGGSDGWRPRTYVPLPISEGSATGGGGSGGGRCTDEAKRRR